MQTVSKENSLFICECINNRNGFKHKATYLKNNIEVQTASIQYYNRTWESYTYQTAILAAIQKEIDQQIANIKNDLLATLCINSLRSKEAKELFASYINSSTQIIELNELKNYFKKL